MRGNSRFLLFGIICVFLLTGCGGGSYSNNNPSPMQQPQPQAAAQVSLSATDAPPVGVTVLSFEVWVTGATLNPGTVDLLAGKAAIRLEVKKLETENAFLSTASVPAGDYTSLNLTFANPELTFRNDSSTTLAGCAPGNVCEIAPSGPLSATVNGQFTATSGMQTGVLVDLNLANLVTQSLGVDFSTSTAVLATQQSGDAEGHLEDLEDLSGIVGNAGPGQFTLQTADMGRISVSVDSNTEFDGFDPCTMASVTCLQKGQSVDVDLILLANGSFLAKKIQLHDDASEAADDELDGVISKIDSPSQFEIVVIDELRDVTSVSVGDPVTVMLRTSSGGTSFRVDADGLQIPASLQQAFESQTDTSQLVPGQTVQVRKRDLAGGPAPAAITLTTDRVRLRATRLTAAVSGAPSGSNFNIGNLPGLFAANGITLIQIQTSPKTSFENADDLSGFVDGTSVSVRGLLFSSTPTPVLIADKVRKR
jgi:Domain of unknown function (DUF5666)